MSLNLVKAQWRPVRLGDVVQRSREQVDPVELGVGRYVGGGHIDADSITVSRWGNPSDGQMGSTFRYVFRPGQVLFVSARPYLRKMGVVDFSGVVADKTYVLEAIPDKGLLQAFLPLILSSDPFIEYAKAEATGSMNPRLLWGPFQRYEFRLPPLDEQKRIADLLWAAERHRGALTRELQAVVGVRRAHLYERMKEIGAGAGLVALDDLIEDGRPITYGILMPGNGVPNGVPVVKVRDFPNGVIEGDLLLTSHELAYEYRRSTLRGGDLIVSIRGTVGRLAEVPDSLTGANITQDTARLSIAEQHDRHYVRLALESELVQAQMRRMTTGLAVKGLNIAALRQVQIPVPASEHEEAALVKESRVVSEGITQLTDAINALRDVRASLLAEIFGGD